MAATERRYPGVPRFARCLEHVVEHRDQEDADGAGNQHAGKHRGADVAPADLGRAIGDHSGTRPRMKAKDGIITDLNRMRAPSTPIDTNIRTVSGITQLSQSATMNRKAKMIAMVRIGPVWPFASYSWKAVSAHLKVWPGDYA
jgi:hypothetical protein